ncbi:MAG: class I SAM-dependent methyltransferase [Anaerolineae bacterium]|nr:class I SAM-dependent methyltransferase [Anaerolineae bacterium]
MLQRLWRSLLFRVARRLPLPVLEKTLLLLIKDAAARTTPDEALRLLLRLDNRLYALQGEYSVRYGAGTHTKHRHLNYHDFFVARIQPGEHVLDIGCGMGAVAYDVAERAGATVSGIDILAESIATARQRYAHPRVTYLVGDVLQGLPPLTAPVQVVILSNVLEHLPDRAQFLRRVVATVQPQRLFIRVPLFERDWRVPLKKELGLEWRLDDTHETEYTLESYHAEMAAAGLTVTHLEVRWGEIWSVLVPAAA